MQLIQLINLSLSDGNKTILEHIDLEQKLDNFTALIGNNGAGKSSLIRCLLGITKYQGKRIINPKTRIGYVPQNTKINQTIPLTVKHFIQLNTQNSHQDPIYPQLPNCDILNIEHLYQQNLYSLSGGEMQRVVLARALARDPNLLILDEPTKGMDFKTCSEFYELLQHLNQHHQVSILIATHDLPLILNKAKKIICIDRHLTCQGTPDTIIQHPEFNRLFGNAITANL